MNVELYHVLRCPLKRAAFNYGKWRSGYMHVDVSLRQIVRSRINAYGEEEAAKRVAYLSRRNRPYRRALYLGIIAGLRAERRMMEAFAL
jgi:hypothetical protein